MTDLQAQVLEQVLAHKARVKRRFRVIVRHVINNLPWLIEDDDEIIPLEDVQRNIKKLMSSKKKKKLLTLKDKSVLRKPPEDRTPLEQRRLYNVIGGLKAIRKYPPFVQEKLAATTYFQFFKAGRVLYREGQKAHNMYFLISGECLMTQTIWDEVINEWTVINIMKKGPGSTFGELALLHDIPRLYTIHTIAPCELLYLTKEDFNRVLRETLKKKWDEILEAISGIKYFNEWDDIARRECCILSKIKYFEPNQIVLGDELKLTGTAMVYFIIEGSCKLIEHLMTIEEVKRGIKTYRLYDPDQQTGGLKEEYSLLKRSKVSFHDKTAVLKTSSLSQSTGAEKGTSSRMLLSSSSLSQKLSKARESSATLHIIKEHDSSSQTEIEQEEDIAQTGSFRFPASKSISKHINSASCNEPAISIAHHSSYGGSRIQGIKRQEEPEEKGVKLPTLKQLLPSHVKLRFMQVAYFTKYCAFKLDEHLKNRRIVAIDNVKCLLIPEYWLQLHNYGNIWPRLEAYLSYRIPKTETVLKAYKDNLKWQEYRSKIRADCLGRKKHQISNDTTVHDVPYSIRIMYELDQ